MPSSMTLSELMVGASSKQSDDEAQPASSGVGHHTLSEAVGHHTLFMVGSGSHARNSKKSLRTNCCEPSRPDRVPTYSKNLKLETIVSRSCPGNSCHIAQIFEKYENARNAINRSKTHQNTRKLSKSNRNAQNSQKTTRKSQKSQKDTINSKKRQEHHRNLRKQ